MKVAIQKLENGLHAIDTEEVKAEEIGLDESEFYPKPIIVSGEIDKFDLAYRLKLDVVTTARFRCERCLDEFDKQIEEHIEQIYQEGEGGIAEDGDVQVLSKDAIEINIDDILCEAFLVQRPIRIVCKEDCKGLCASCGTNLNHASCNCKTQEIDPRLEKLKSLLK